MSSTSGLVSRVSAINYGTVQILNEMYVHVDKTDRRKDVEMNRGHFGLLD